MHRAFAIDVLACPHCGGRLRLIATLHDPAVIRKILAHPPHPEPISEAEEELMDGARGASQDAGHSLEDLPGG